MVVDNYLTNRFGFAGGVWERARHKSKEHAPLDLYAHPLPWNEFWIFLAICFSFSLLAGLQDVESLVQSGVWTASLTGNVVQMALALTNKDEVLIRYKHEWWFYLAVLSTNLGGTCYYLVLTRRLNVKRPALWCALQYVVFEGCILYFQREHRQKLADLPHGGDRMGAEGSYAPKPWQTLFMAFSWGTMIGFCMHGPLLCSTSMW